MANVRVPRIAFVSAITALLLLAPVTASAQATSNPRVLPPSSMAYGKTYGGWSAAWWQYVERQPGSTNPTNKNSTGAGCGQDQSGPVFFLVGTGDNSGDPVVRNQCVVPAGKALFFPLVNVFDFHVDCTPQTTNVCDTNLIDPPGSPLGTGPWEDLEISATYQILSLHATIDGVPLSLGDPTTTPYRACAGPTDPKVTNPSHCGAPAFFLTFQTDNLFSPGLPAGTFGPSVSDGAWLLLAPLSPGRHTLSFGGTAEAGGSPNSQNITYNLTVAP